MEYTDKAQLADIYKLSRDEDFQNRLRVACTNAGIDNPDVWVNTNIIWASMWGSLATKYAIDLENPYSVKSGENPAVITDNNIEVMLSEWKNSHSTKPEPPTEVAPPLLGEM